MDSLKEKIKRKYLTEYRKGWSPDDQIEELLCEAIDELSSVFQSHIREVLKDEPLEVELNKSYGLPEVEKIMNTNLIRNEKLKELLKAFGLEDAK